MLTIAVLLGVVAVVSLYTKRASFIGSVAEQRVQHILSKLPIEHHVALHDVMIRRGNGKTTQIDHIVVSDYGLFVIETKNYHGHIYGRENERYWTQRIGRQRHRLYNPFWQNRGHIEALRELLGPLAPSEIRNLVVFGDKVGLTIHADEPVLRMNQLYKFLLSSNSPVLSAFERSAIVRRVEESNITDTAEREKHVERLRGEKESRKRRNA